MIARTHTKRQDTFMDRELVIRAAENLATEDKDILALLEQTTGHSGAVVAYDMRLRHGLIDSLENLGKGTRLLLMVLKDQEQALSPENRILYQQALGQISVSANQGTEWVLRSQDFDSEISLAIEDDFPILLQ